VGPYRGAGIAGAGAAGALLFPGLAGGVADFALGERALGSLTAVGQMILDGIVQHVLVRLNAEDGLGELDLADLAAIHVVYVSFRHLRHSPSLFITRRGLLRIDTRGSLLRVGADSGSLALLDGLSLDGGLDVDDAALGAGDCAADHQHVQLGVNLHDVQILDGDLIDAHMAGADVAREYAAGVGA